MESRPYKVPELAAPAFWHFEDVLDFIWKAPEFIDAQREIETENLKRGRGAAGAQSRWALEHRKLWKVFPGLLANANVFLVASLLELHLQMILEGVTVDPPPTKGRGIRDTLKALTELGLDAQRMVRWPQIDALIRIRNCLMHSAGVLERSRDGDGIRTLVKERTYVDSKASAHKPVKRQGYASYVSRSVAGSL